MHYHPRPIVTASCFLLAGSVACTEITALPAGSRSLDPPPEYELWWSMTESCSGIQGALANIEWYMVPNTDVLPGTNDLSGEWFPQRNRIVLAASSQHAGGLVRHEMLHALLQDAGHVREEFLGRCGGVVDCVEACIRDAGPPTTPPAGTPTVSTDALDVAIQINPASPGSAVSGGYFTLTVTARNPASHDIVVALPKSGDSGPSLTFVLTVALNSTQRSSGNYRAYDPGVTRFAAGETKRQVFDFHVGSDATFGGLLPGMYTAFASFGNTPAQPVAFTLNP